MSISPQQLAIMELTKPEEDADALKRQLALEKEMLDLGISRYVNKVNRVQSVGLESESSYGSRLLSNCTETVAVKLQEYQDTKGKRGNKAMALRLLSDIEPEKAAMIALKVVIDKLSTLDVKVTDTAMKIGRKIEDEVRFSAFKLNHWQAFDDLLRDFKQKNTQSYRLIQKRMTYLAEALEDGWRSWVTEEKLHVGILLIDIIVNEVGLVMKKNRRRGTKLTAMLEITPEAMDWITKHNTGMQFMYPDFMPCLVPPRDWEGLRGGGYYSPELQRRCGFIKTKDAEHAKAIAHHDYSIHMHGVNLMQNTGWKINKPVYDVLKEVWEKSFAIGMPETEPFVPPEPPFLKDREDCTEAELEQLSQWKREATIIFKMEKERVAKLLGLKRTLLIASKFRDEKEFYFVYSCDFRGRVYCSTAGLSPQGADLSRGVLTFSSGVSLGESGGRHLRIHGANTYGVDKLSYSDRVKWVEEHREHILATAANPLGSKERGFWGEADKPYQFLAFCFEYSNWAATGYSTEFVSHLPIAADGSCNGLQNFSAMLKDEIGGKATNLCPVDKPADIYQEVANRVIETLKKDAVRDVDYEDELDVKHREFANQWLKLDIGRKLTKKPVMTLPYGSTLSACADSVETWLYERELNLYFGKKWLKKSVNYLAKVIWAAISDVVVAARAAQKWLQNAARVLSREGAYLCWVSPTGFKVYRRAVKHETRRVQTLLCGSTRLTVAFPTNKTDMRRQVSGVSPNFVHSMDASHLIMTVISSNAEGISSFAMIHDDYGTHAGNMDTLHRVLREQFVRIYGDTNWLYNMKSYYEDGWGIQLPALPPTGTLNVSEVLNAEYFFG